MDTVNIVLWTTSLTLAVIGITFGIVASYNSKKANDKIRDILTVSFAAEEAQKLFFEQMKSSVLINKKAIKSLEDNDITYENYEIISTTGRFIPLSNNAIKILQETEFKELVNDYIKIKLNLDDMFFGIFNNDMSILSTDRTISKEVKEALTVYHDEVIKNGQTITKRYNQIISFTREVRIEEAGKRQQ